ncbi:hypothetical protein [Nocardioides sp.]|uniref:hypothetical protein n=1 Tax=Nocardioides sp. TaxID=35761 RepID=UPI00261D7AA4|nr:hypothetical protein [Nocardioides sp.]MCW2737657.1 hypothetical protein [Nocardioides sp.]
MLRVTTLVALLSAVLFVSACTASDGGGAGADEPTGQDTSSTAPGCGDCEAELAAVRSQVEQLADVERIRTLEKYGSSPTNGDTVNLELFSAGVGDTGLADEVAAIVWRSDLAPVDVVTIAIEDSAGDLVPTLPYDFRDGSRQHATYVQQWGPRPVEE